MSRRNGMCPRVIVFCLLVALLFLLLRPVGGAGQAGSFFQRIRHISSNDYTRVVVDLSGEVSYDVNVLEGIPEKGLPPRLYMDLRGARIGSEGTEPVLIQDRLLRQVRVGQFLPDVVRVVLDLRSLGSYKVFSLQDPFRLVVDVQAVDNGARSKARKKGKRQKARLRVEPQPQGIRKIVLDPGHGGKDPGAVGPGGLAEKDIVLNVAKKLARKLKREMGIEVVLTRKDDSFVPLEDRTAIANAENADLFISLHVNAHPDSRVRGMETYYLNNTDDEASIRLAARENATSRRHVSDLQFILSDLIQSYKLEDSISLAHHLQASLVSQVGRRYPNVNDLGVKKALFYVLVGARMPSVLLELSFITNRGEARRLKSRRYQDAVVDALYEGIRKYRSSTQVARNL